MPLLRDLINSPETPDLSKLSWDDACDVLAKRATELDVTTLTKEWQQKIATQEPGMVPGLLVKGKFGMEEVIVCTSLAAGYIPNRDAFTMSKHDWLMLEGRRIGEQNKPPHMARALKLFARSELGARVPMLCPVIGLTEETLMSHGHQVVFAMEELIRVGKIFFPSMDTVGEAFETFRLVLDECLDRLGAVKEFARWRRDTFVQACLDMVALDKKNVLQDMSVSRAGVDQDRVANAFRNVLLYQKNLDLGYIFGSLEATGVWPAAGHGLFKAAKELHQDSLHHLHRKLQV